ncbi:hypothetical protein CHS0354_015624 [Potamilus streckersoni]|uniref:Uncharacterized protein n=1 Tax=Potamilus streckersoni TaxID=2493646 RepID=A0AAE0T626_9BIVA|nr:hypothetical protein CHS0354_015624 [Potamilus streckersoni]
MILVLNKYIWNDAYSVPSSIILQLLQVSSGFTLSEESTEAFTLEHVLHAATPVIVDANVTTPAIPSAAYRRQRDYTCHSKCRVSTPT